MLSRKGLEMKKILPLRCPVRPVSKAIRTFLGQGSTAKNRTPLPYLDKKRNSYNTKYCG
jgi:hypothetical protein